MEELYRNKIYQELEKIVADKKQMSAQDFADFEMKLIELRHYEEDKLTDLTMKFNAKRAELQKTMSSTAAKYEAEASEEWLAMKKQESIVARIKCQLATARSQTFIRK